MSIYERNTLCFNAKICMKCHDPEYVWKSNDSSHECKKTSYTCKHCPLHMWVCKKHKTENKEALDKFKKRYRKDFKLEFGLLVIGSLYGHIAPRSITKRKSKLSSAHKSGNFKKKKSFAK